MNEETPTIIQLPPDVINQISAGEVIHQPFNVVKELFENALDAGATQIIVSLENGGFSRIQISDNGCGIPHQDLPHVCKRHTTSKLHKFSDIYKLTTFGFRGEALFSMSCVSHLSITTKTESSDVALIANYENGKMINSPEPIASVNGTTIEVKDLFYNKPEKVRSIPDANSQNRQVLQITTQYAVAFPQCSIITIIEGKERLHTIGNTTTEAVISLVYGVTSSSAIFRVEADLGYKVTAKLFLGAVVANRQMKGSTVFVNERLVSCEKVKKNVENVYSRFLMKGDKPFFVVMLQIPPKDVDVNVHPTKRDVNFANSQTIVERLCNVVNDHLAERIGGRAFKSKSSTANAMKQIPENQPTLEKTLSNRNNKQSSQIPIKGVIQSATITNTNTNDLNTYSIQTSNQPHDTMKDESEMKKNPEIEKDDDDNYHHDNHAVDEDDSDDEDSVDDTPLFDPVKSPEINEQINRVMSSQIDTQILENDNESQIKKENESESEIQMPTNKKFGLNARPLSQNSSQMKQTNFQSNLGNSAQTNSQTTSQIPSQSKQKKKSSISLFDDLKYEPISSASKLIRGDHKERTIEQMLSLAATTKMNINAEYKEINLESINELREEVLNNRIPSLCNLFKKHILVGFIQTNYVFFSCDDVLYRAELFPLTRQFFYQLFLRHFGNYGKITFDPPLDITQICLMQNTNQNRNELPNQLDGQNENSCSDDVVEEILKTLETYKEMLEEYFNIGYEDGKLKFMPDMLPGYEPSFTFLDVFFKRLTTQIKWHYEYDCIAGILEELSLLYAVQPEDSIDPKLMEDMKKMVTNVVMPEMKTEAFMPNSQLIDDQAIMKVQTVSGMYKIFERT
ncbi:DNA mismatch repair protein [Tritrichomonas foetus]|uniref:DNA mismatch repair protein n=1 Tax=Tritrichomonas foetus TaxID=1144522 RepID=A0A1J4K7M5_9EUKA|nr:DNA mismatch repair protein [Tritrichomonas foetus]|eukprot:OHT06888.1 DNA mismatch repair protein [Tritrichomonas foetus]